MDDQRRAAPPPPTDRPPVEGTPAPAGLLAISAVGTDVAPAVGAATTAKVAADAADTLLTASFIAALLIALHRFFRRKRETDARFLQTTLKDEFPQQPDDEIRKVLMAELRFEQAFQMRQLARIERDLNAIAGGQPNHGPGSSAAPGTEGEPLNAYERARRIAAIMDREKRYMQMREDMMLTRARSAIERGALKVSSPEGAYWRLSPHVREHTLDCIYMGGKFWPWAVLDLIHPPMHPGCPCMLFGRDEAIASGWMSEDDPIPSDGDALHQAQRAIDIARAREQRRLRLQEAAHGAEQPTMTAAANTLGLWVQSLGPPSFEVGGAVRDRLLDRIPTDVDYVVFASPREIKEAVIREHGRADELRVRDRVVGIRAHLTGVTPVDGVEIAPPRIERSTGASRHDFEIIPHPALGESTYDTGELLAADARRRDFTINALYRNTQTGEISDPLGIGLQDLQSGILRTTSAESFREDPLRILRAARFVSQHGFAIEPGTLAQMHEQASAIDALTRRGVSGTARRELNKLLLGEHVGDGLRLLRDTGALARLLPEFAPSIGFDQESRYHDLTVDEHIIRVVEQVAAQGAGLDARLAALFHDVGKPEAAFRGANDGRLHYYADPRNGNRDHADIGADLAHAALERLNYPRRTIEQVTTLVREHMLTAADRPTPVRARRLRARFGDEEIANLFALRRADHRSKRDLTEAPLDTPGLDRLQHLVAEAAEQDAPRSMRDLAIDGQDAMALGYRPGPAIGALMRDLLREAVDQPKLNTREWLLGQAEKRRRRLEATNPPADSVPSEIAEAVGDAWVRRHALLGDDYDAADYDRAISRHT